MSSGTSAAESGLLMLPMMVGLMGTAIYSGIRISKTGRYKMFPIIGRRPHHGRHAVDDHPDGRHPASGSSASSSSCFGAGLGLIMQVVVLVVQNSVPADQIGTATSTNNYFREVGAALGVAVFGSHLHQPARRVPDQRLHRGRRLGRRRPRSPPARWTRRP